MYLFSRVRVFVIAAWGNTFHFFLIIDLIDYIIIIFVKPMVGCLEFPKVVLLFWQIHRDKRLSSGVNTMKDIQDVPY